MNPYFCEEPIMAKQEKFLITGFSGFVSEHFLELLEKKKLSCSVLGLDLHEPEFKIDRFKHLKCRFQKADLLDKSSLQKALKDFKPDFVLHLASYSSVAFSWKNPVESFRNNTNIFLNLIETIHSLGIPCRVISVGSSEEYGNVKKSDLPLKENHQLNPISPYAVARVSQEMLSKVYVESFGMDIILTRSFNHIGARQKEIFVIPSFAKQLLDLKGRKDKKVLYTGDTSIVRDFVDVRDVVEAYYLLFRKGKKGEIYNICSGTGKSLNQVISTLCSILEIQVQRKTDPSKVRPNDNRAIIGSNQKIRKHTGWKPKFDLERSLHDILNHLEKA